MKDALSVDELRLLRPHALERLLSDLGWELEHEQDSSSVWSTEAARVMVPRDRTYSDYLLRLNEAVSVLREIDPDGWRLNLPSLYAIRSDILRFRSIVETPFDGSVPLAPGIALMDSVPELLKAAAKASTDDKLPYYAQRNHDLARQYMDTARLGQTARGSFVVTVISRLPEPEVDQEDEVPELLPRNPPVPLARVVNMQLVRALAAARDAAAEFSVTSDFSVFQNAVPNGVSAELCGAAVGMLELGGDIEFSFAPTFDMPTVETIESRIRLDRSHLPAFATAHDEFRRSAALSDVLVRGIVESLNRTGTRGPGTVSIKVTGGVDANKVRVRLEEGEYSQAIDAHRDGRELIVEGRLEREGNLFWLYDASRFQLGDVVLSERQIAKQKRELYGQGSMLDHNE